MKKDVNYKILFLVIIFTVSCLQLSAKNKLRVATRNLEPFSFESLNERTGYSVDLWNEICDNLNIDYEWVIVNSGDEIIEAVKNGKADIGVGACSVTFDREKSVDFTHPFYESGLQILVNKNDSGSSSFIDILKNIFTFDVLVLLIVLLVIIFIVSNLIWFFERKVNSEQWPKEYKSGIFESIWFTLTTMVVGGTDNKGPIGMGGRIVSLFWMLLSTIFISFITATITTTMTINQLNSKIKGPEDLPGLKVATITGSSTVEWLRKKEIQTVSFKNLSGCLKEMQKNKVDAVVYDAPILQFEISKQGNDKVQLVGPVFNRQYYAFPVKENDKITRDINEILLKLYENDYIPDLKRKYFDDRY